MEIGKPHLFIEINEKSFVFLAVKYDEDFNFRVLHSVTGESEGISEGKVTDVNNSSKIIKNYLDIIEKKIHFTFENVIVINDQKNFSCVNISGFKRLNGSQILDENISYILNDIKKLVLDNQSEKSLIHLFNSDFILDHNSLKNPPIGLHGEFYNHHLTFFLLPKNDLKNLKLLFNKCNLKIDRIILKPFAQGVKKIIDNEIKETFAAIDISTDKSNISIFKNHSFVYSETFPFGTDIIKKDVSKVCSLNMNIVKNIFSELNFNLIKENEEEKYLSEKYFQKEIFRKISLNHLNDIIMARIEEIVDIIYRKNVNLKDLQNETKFIYFTFEDSNFFKNLRQNFERMLPEKKVIRFEERTQDERTSSCLASAELTGKGWEREAIPTIQTKKSIISRLFSTFFK